MLQQVFPSQETYNKIIWAFTKSSIFSTKLFTLLLDKLRPPSHHDASKEVWKGLVPHRIVVFVWIALTGKINTRSKLASLEIIPIESSIFPLGSLESEMSDHLLLHCVFSYQLWMWWIDLWQINWVFPLNLQDLSINDIGKKITFLQKGMVNFFFSLLCGQFGKREITAHFLTLLHLSKT